MFTITTYKDFDVSTKRVVTVQTWQQAMARMDAVVTGVLYTRKAQRLDFTICKEGEEGYLRYLFYRENETDEGLIGECYSTI